MSDTKKRRNGRDGKTRSGNSSSTASRESLHDSTALNTSSDDLRLNGGRSHNNSRRSNPSSSSSQSNSYRRSKNSASQNGASSSVAAFNGVSQGRSKTQQQRKSLSSENLNSGDGKSSGRRHGHQQNGSTARTHVNNKVSHSFVLF